MSTATENDTDDLELEGSENVETPNETPTPEPKPVTEDALARAMESLAGKISPREPARSAEPELTEEQKREMWAVYDPKKGRADFMKKFFRLNPDASAEEEAEAEGLFADMQKGFVKQAIVGSRNIMLPELEKLRQEFAPLQEYISQRKQEELRGRFYKEYPALEDERYGAVIDAVASGMRNREFKSEKEFFKAVAEAAAGSIRKLVPDFDLGKTQTKPAGTAPRLPRTSAGGTGGVGAGKSTGSGKASDDDMLDIFD